MTNFDRPERGSRGHAAAKAGEKNAVGLQKLQAIRSIGETAPVKIVPVVHRYGTATSLDEVMAAKVRWASQAGYTILTTDVPSEFSPFNTVIRVNESGTEDKDLDYLALIVDAAP